MEAGLRAARQCALRCGEQLPAARQGHLLFFRSRGASVARRYSRRLFRSRASPGGLGARGEEHGNESRGVARYDRGAGALNHGGRFSMATTLTNPRNILRELVALPSVHPEADAGGTIPGEAAMGKWME